MQKVLAAFQPYFLGNFGACSLVQVIRLICPKLALCIITVIFWKLEAKKKKKGIRFVFFRPLYNILTC